MGMSGTVRTKPAQEARLYHRAVELLDRGDPAGGARLLGRIAKQTENDQLRSQCVYNIGEVLTALGQADEAYRTYYALAHKPPDQRHDFDLHARCRVMEMFANRALRLQPPDFPPKVQVEITNRCNLRCVMCPRTHMTRPQGHLTLDTFRQIADQCADDAGCVLSLFFLGEPLLNPELPRMIEYLESVRGRSPVPPAYGLQTNGTLLTRERSEALLRAGLREISISLDATDDTLERVRPGASYAAIERHIAELLRAADELGIDDLNVTIAKLCDDPQSAEAASFRDRWSGRVAQVHLMPINKIEGLSFLAADGSIREVGEKEHGPPRAYCGEGARLLIHWNGDFGFCCNDINGELELGNIRNRGIREAWNSPEMRRIRRKIAAADYTGLSACYKCPHSYI